MTPIKTKTTTKTLGAPKGWNEADKGPCQGLPVTEAHGNLYSYWKPTLKERLKLVFGKPLTLIVAGSNQPPIALEVQ